MAVIINRAIYVDGVRSTAGDVPLDEMFEASRAVGGMTWIGMAQPSKEDFEQVAAEFGLHPLAV